MCMTVQEQAYAEGFMNKCAALGVDPEQLVKAAQWYNPTGSELWGAGKQLWNAGKQVADIPNRIGQGMWSGMQGAGRGISSAVGALGGLAGQGSAAVGQGAGQWARALPSTRLTAMPGAFRQQVGGAWAQQRTPRTAPPMSAELTAGLNQQQQTMAAQQQKRQTDALARARSRGWNPQMTETALGSAYPGARQHLAQGAASMGRPGVQQPQQVVGGQQPSQLTRG